MAVLEERMKEKVEDNLRVVSTVRVGLENESWEGSVGSGDFDHHLIFKVGEDEVKDTATTCDEEPVGENYLNSIAGYLARDVADVFVERPRDQRFYVMRVGPRFFLPAQHFSMSDVYDLLQRKPFQLVSKGYNPDELSGKELRSSFVQSMAIDLGIGSETLARKYKTYLKKKDLLVE